MGNKRIASLLIPYKIKNGKVFVYLQKRTKDAKTSPGFFGFFGGSIEGEENLEEGLKREIKEELDFVPNGYKKLGSYNLIWGVNNIFVLEVSDNFEKETKVLEGEYGKFFNENEILKEPKISKTHRKVLNDLYKFVRAEK